MSAVIVANEDTHNNSVGDSVYSFRITDCVIYVSNHTILCTIVIVVKNDV